MAYDSKDILQQALGAFSTVLFVYILRDSPLWIDANTGLILGVIWLIIVYNPFVNQPKEAKVHFIGAVIVSLVITVSLTVAFDLATLEELKGFQFFGSLAWLTMLIGIPVAILFDKRNAVDIVSRYFITGGKTRK